MEDFQVTSTLQPLWKFGSNCGLCSLEHGSFTQFRDLTIIEGRNVHILEVPNISLDTAAGLLKMRPITLITHDPPTCSCCKNMIISLLGSKVRSF